MTRKLGGKNTKGHEGNKGDNGRKERGGHARDETQTCTLTQITC